MKRSLLYISMIFVLSLGMTLQAQEVKVTDYQDKVESLQAQSENAANLLKELIDGSANAIFVDSGNNQPTEYIRGEDGVVAVLRADNPEQVGQLMRQFPQHLSTIRVIDVKWNGQGELGLLDNDLEKMENLEYINVRMEAASGQQMMMRSSSINTQNALQSSLSQLKTDNNIEILYRNTEQAR